MNISSAFKKVNFYKIFKAILFEQRLFHEIHSFQDDNFFSLIFRDNLRSTIIGKSTYMYSNGKKDIPVNKEL